jgi:hypothetical protein
VIILSGLFRFVLLNKQKSILVSISKKIIEKRPENRHEKKATGDATSMKEHATEIVSGEKRQLHQNLLGILRTSHRSKQVLRNQAVAS